MSTSVSPISFNSFYSSSVVPYALSSCFRKTVLAIGAVTLTAGAITTAVGFVEDNESAKVAGFALGAVGFSITASGAGLTCVAMRIKKAVTFPNLPIA